MNINNYLEIAKGKVNNKYVKTLLLAIYAGIFISLAGLLSTVVSLKITNYSVAKILSGLVFPIGLILVILFKTELFTGNSLLIIPVLNKDIKIKQLLRNWLIVYIGNFLGALLIAILIYNTPLKDTISSSIINTAHTKINYSWIEAIILGAFCNFLVCISAFLASTVKSTSEKILVIFIPIFMFIVLSFEHSIANMLYLSLGYLLESTLTIKAILINNLLPVTIGNILGGLFLGVSIWFLREK
jgi:hypothetical protein